MDCESFAKAHERHFDTIKSPIYQFNNLQKTTYFYNSLKFRKLNSGQPHHRFTAEALMVGLPDMIVRWDEMRAKKKREKQGK